MAESSMQHQKERKNLVEERRAHSPVLYWGTVVTLVLIVVTFVIGPVIGSGYAKSIVLGKAAGKKIYFDENFGYMWEQYERNLASAYGLDLQTVPDYMKSQLRTTAFQGAFFMRAYDNFVELIQKKSGITATTGKAEKLIAESILSQDEVSMRESLKAYKELSDRQKQEQIDAVKQEYLSTLFRNDLSLIPEITDFESSFLNEKAFPEKRSLRYIQIDDESVPDSSFAEYASADDKAFLFTKISFRKILVSTKTEMDFLLSEIKADPTQFDTLAKDSTIDTDEAKETELYFYEILNEFGTKKEKDFRKLIDLKAGDLSDVIKTEYGYLLYKITKDAVAPDFSEKSVIDKVRDYVTYNDEDVLASLVAELTTSVGEAAKRDGLDKTAGEFGLSVLQTKPFPVNIDGLAAVGKIQNEKNEDILVAFSGDDSFFRTVFSARQGTVSDVVYGANYNIIYEVDEIVSGSATGEKSEMATLIPGADEGFHAWILNHKSYRDDTNKFMETYSEMFSYSGE